MRRLVLIAVGSFVVVAAVTMYRAEGGYKPPSYREIAGDSSPRRMMLLVVLEPGVCLGCSQWPEGFAQLQHCARRALAIRWRRKPTARELLTAAPLRLGVVETLPQVWPKAVPSGPRFLHYTHGTLTAVDSMTDPLSARSIVQAVLTSESQQCPVPQ